MNNEVSIKELCKQLWELEAELSLLSLEIKGIRFWELVRFIIFNELSKKTIGFGDAHTNKNSFMNKLLNVFNIIKYSILRNPFSGNYTVDFLVYDHPRKININGSIIDIYTNEFIRNIDNNKFDIIEKPYLWKHSTSNLKRNRRYTEHEVLINFINKRKFTIDLDQNDKNLINFIEEELRKRFVNIDIDLYKIILKALQNFILKKNYHKKLFEKRKPDNIFIVVYYSNYPVIAAAKDLGIKVIEFQHGLISDYNFAYNFSEPNKQLAYFPDKLLTFGEYWGKTKRFPKQTEVEVYGFPYLNSQLEKFQKTPKKKGQILFLSQGTIGKKLAKQAYQMAKSMPNYNFIFKLHPGEYDRWRKEYPQLIEALNISNFEVVDNNDRNLYKLLAESEFQIGVYSTALFEGLALNCKTILLNLPGIEYMEDLIDKRIVKVANNTKDAITIIKNYKQKVFSKDYFFKSN